jgi:hypothetical protein
MKEYSIYIYPLLVISLGILSFTAQFRKYAYTISLIIIIVSSHLFFHRDPMAATDAQSYQDMYSATNTYQDIWNIYHGNIFFSFIMFIGKSLSLDYIQFMKILPIFYLFLICLGLLFIIPRRFLPLCLAFFVTSDTFILVSINIIRQGLAMSLLILSVGLYFKNYRLLSYLIMILSIFSHFSSLFVCLIFLISESRYWSNFRLNKKYLIWNQNTGSFTFIFFFLILILPLLGYFSLFSLATILGNIFTNLPKLFNLEYDNILAYIRLLILFFAIILFQQNKKSYGVSQYQFNSILRLFAFLVALSFYLSPVMILSSRFYYYATFFSPILLVYFFQSTISQKNKYSRIYLFSLFPLIFMMIGSGIMYYPSISNQMGF